METVHPSVEKPPDLPPHPEKHTFFSVPKIALLSIILILGIVIGGFITFKNTTSPSKTPSIHTNTPTLFIQPTVTTSIPTSPIQKLVVSSWQSYQDHFNEIIVNYPQDWVANSCFSAGSGERCTMFYPKKETQTVFPELITYNTYPIDSSRKEGTLIQDSFPITALLNNEKAQVFKLADGTIQVQFIHTTIPYTFSIKKENAQLYNINLESAENILKQMAQSVTFLNEPYSCKNPALAPLSAFPESFTLSNGHESDGTDPINSINPYSRPLTSSESTRQPPSNDMTRIFMVNYIKSGTAFINPTFGNTVTAIQGYVPEKNDFTTSTALFHVNCIDTQEDGPGSEDIYHISSDDNDPFALHLYGYKNNSSNLWDVSQWNVKLLTQTRNEVYVRMGNQWQKYIATGYFVSIVNAYGGKPAIYLYPKKTSSIEVTIHPQGKLIKTDDLYNSKTYGWSVVAQPNGTINDSYPYLYYEALFPFKRPNNGYIIPYENLFSFTDQYIQKLGLDKKEAEEFINYWQRILQPAPYYFVSHLDLSTINSLYPLSISPKPDSLLRVEIYFEPVTEKISIKPPSFPPSFKRTGFTAVEWGAIYNK